MTSSLQVVNNSVNNTPSNPDSRFHKRSQSTGTEFGFDSLVNTDPFGSMSKSSIDMVPVDLVAPSSSPPSQLNIPSWEAWDETEPLSDSVSEPHSVWLNNIGDSKETSSVEQKQDVPLLISFTAQRNETGDTTNRVLLENSSCSDIDPNQSQSSFDQLSSIDLSATNSSSFRMEPSQSATSNQDLTKVEFPNVFDSVGASSGEDTIIEQDQEGLISNDSVEESCKVQNFESSSSSPKLTSRATSSISVLSEENKDVSSLPCSPVIHNHLVPGSKVNIFQNHDSSNYEAGEGPNSSLAFETLHVNTDEKINLESNIKHRHDYFEESHQTEDSNDSLHVSPSSNHTVNSEQSSSSIVVVSAPPSSTYDSEPLINVDSTDERLKSYERVDPPSSVGSIRSDQSREHKKAASSASSSDIEIIPYDTNYHHHTEGHHEDRVIKELVDVQVQTEVDSEGLEEASNTKLSKTEAKKSSKLEQVIQEKDLEIQQLREEGEKLSKKQFDLSNVIKKLRAKEKETEAITKNLKVDLFTKQAEVEQLMKTFVKKEGFEHTQNEVISKLNEEKGKLELKVEDLSSKLEDMTENCTTMKLSVENASR